MSSHANSQKTALLLEGGGLRGVFTSGVLEAFLEAGLTFDHVYGVSAGASNAVTFLAGQKGRNKRVFIDYIKDPRYMGFKSWLFTGNFFNKQFIFERIPNELDPFDFQAFKQNKTQLFMPVTDAKTGKTVFLTDFSSSEKLSKALKAATSLPVLSQPEAINDKMFYDGGISCPLIFESVDFSQYSKVIYVLTQPNGYRKQPSKHPLISKLMLLRYPSVYQAMQRRHAVYNQTLENIASAALIHPNFKVIQPDGSVEVARTETDKDKMIESYQLGFRIGKHFIANNRAINKETV